MPIGYESQSYPEGLWDIGRLVRNGRGQAQSSSAGFRQSPTAVTPAVWALNANSFIVYLWSIRISSDTAINYTMGVLATNPGYTGRNGIGLGPGASGAARFEADVTAAPALAGPAQFGRIGADKDIEVFAPAWWCSQNQPTWIVYTDTVAASVTVTFKWSEMSS